MKKFNLLKYLMLLLVGLFFTLSASADDCLKNYKIAVWENGALTPLTAFELEYGATVTFNEGQIIITNDVADVIFDRNLDEIWKLTYQSKHPSEIKDILADNDAMKFDGNSILFPALKAGSNITIYATNGMMIMNKSIATDGEYALSLSDLSKGVYIVNVNGKTFKIVKK